MTPTEVKALRIEINAAHDAGNTARANELQGKLHAHFVAESEAFAQSAEGRAHVEALANRFD